MILRFYNPIFGPYNDPSKKSDFNNIGLGFPWNRIATFGKVSYARLQVGLQPADGD